MAFGGVEAIVRILTSKLFAMLIASAATDASYGTTDTDAHSSSQKALRAADSMDIVIHDSC